MRRRMSTRLILIASVALAACAEPAPAVRVPMATPPGASVPDDAPPAPPSVAPPAPLLADAHDLRPTDARLAPPPGWIDPPAVVVPAPAARGWWKRKRPCGKGRHLRTERNPPTDPPEPPLYDWRVAYLCSTPDGVADGPHVTLYADGTIHEEGTSVRGATHGLRRRYTPEGTLWIENTWVHDAQDGVTRAWFDDGGLQHEETYRADVLHGRSRRVVLSSATQTITIEGYFVDGKRHGVWQTAYGDGSVIARVAFDRGRIVGAPRWWYPDGRLWARGAVDGDVVTWTRDSGRNQIELVCEGNAVRAATVSAGGAVVVDGCPATGCTPREVDRDALTWMWPLRCGDDDALAVPVWPVVSER